MHSFRSGCDLLVEMTISLSYSPRSSLIFTGFPPSFMSIVSFEVLNVLSFFFVMLSHRQRHPSVKCSVVNFTNMRCPILSHSKISLDTFSVITPTVNLILIFSCHQLVTEHICQFPSILHHSMELMSWCCVLLSLSLPYILCSKFMQ